MTDPKGRQNDAESNPSADGVTAEGSAARQNETPEQRAERERNERGLGGANPRA